MIFSPIAELSSCLSSIEADAFLSTCSIQAEIITFLPKKVAILFVFCFYGHRMDISAWLPFQN